MLAAGVLLAGCAGNPGQPAIPALPTEALEQAPPTPGATSFTGRLALQQAAGPGTAARSFSAQFELSGTDTEGQLRISTPLGTLLAEARWTPGGASLNTGRGDTAYPDLDTLSRHALGEALPLQALLSWLRGQAWPLAEVVPDATGFTQLGWRIDPSALHNEGLLTATRRADGNRPTLTLRLRLDP